MRQNMHDIISISNKVGFPDISLTMTGNLQCSKVKNALLPGQSIIDRLDICVRVFCIRLRALMAFVIDARIFDEVSAHVRVIEFQRRSLSHAHCIFLTTSQTKTHLLDSAFIKTIILAEIPSEQSNLLR